MPSYRDLLSREDGLRIARKQRLRAASTTRTAIQSPEQGGAMGPGASNNMWKAEAKKVLDHLSAPLQNDLSKLGDKVAAMFRDQLTELHNGNEQEAGQMLSLMFGSNNANQKILFEAFAEVVGATAARKAVFLLSPKR